MDFKVAGTSEFITALQLDTKLDGIPADILASALQQAKEARTTILEVINECIDGPAEMSPYAPRIITTTVPVDKIGEVIGPKGKMINQIQEDTGAEIAIEDDGTVYISSKAARLRPSAPSTRIWGSRAACRCWAPAALWSRWSQQALLDTLQIEIHQAALKSRRLILAPGNYGLDYLAANYPALHEIPIVKISNFIGEALDMAAAAHFEQVLLVGHIGKLVKVAGGIMNTHSHTADCRTELFCTHAALCGASREVCAALMNAATTDACLELLDSADLRAPVLESLLRAVQLHLDRRACGTFRVGAVLFSNQHGRWEPPILPHNC